MRVSRSEFERLVRTALEQIPPDFARYLQRIIVDIEDLPDAATCREMELSDPREIFGLYQGVPLTEWSVDNVERLPDRIVIYQSNLERACGSREELVKEIRLTVLHEIGHHFGLDEDDLDDLGYG